MEMPLEQINALAQTAGAIGENAGKLVTLYKALKSTVLPTEATGDPAIEIALEKLGAEVHNAQLQNQILQLHVTTLTLKLENLHKAQEKLLPYTRHHTPLGAVVYRSPDPDEYGQPAHFICPNCHERGQRSILQGDQYSKRCHPCATWFPFTATPKLSEFLPKDQWMGRK